MARFLVLCFLSLLSFGVFASDAAEATVTIKDHRFFPAELRVPAGRKVRLTVINQDATPEEFESYELNREKVVAGNSRIVVFVGPLARGRYPYFGDFHMTTAKGLLIAD
ncbi:cupredoxin domain-containing protein [Cognatilysobacter lacus]|uniref:Cupredoxin domain-containing protein n=1 Tax=Cognatilysobacter lacus TaxID=1643323 RepID=A0A5D8ZCP5_9GAMM|nr:cupredoxin domain-containing protein [Lysobacter lacus]TZF91833.1 cupredoxin domain-containing protein [Lysobacter lacus]